MSIRLAILSATFAAALCGDAEAGGIPAQKVAMQNASLQTAPAPKEPVRKVAVQGVSVPMDNVALVTFKTAAATVYIGNPSIAQLTVIDSRHVFVMGKRFGATNLIALSADKRLIESDPVTVSSRNAEAVTVFRGEDTYNYVCTDFHCETRPVPGDPKNYFDNTEGPAGEHEDTANKAAGAVGGASASQMH